VYPPWRAQVGGARLQCDCQDDIRIRPEHFVRSAFRLGASHFDARHESACHLESVRALRRDGHVQLKDRASLGSRPDQCAAKGEGPPPAAASFASAKAAMPEFLTVEEVAF